MKRLCIVPCGARKIWDKYPDAGPTRADEAYISPFGKACRRYAARFFDRWVILSAKYGFLLPDDIVPENYDLAFDSKRPGIISTRQLQAQMKAKELDTVSEIVVLGGKKHRRVVTAVFGDGYTYRFPLSDCKGIGYMLQRLNQAVMEGKELDGESARGGFCEPPLGSR
ncbi:MULTISPECIES: DUF6884 domain-containing protein [Aneurinibacillus]|uniref:DUF6884 domain-containing protein n=1 Tax=Aneurinibacillus thermoaerophilus TaxID=143495 RepID=A0A1G7ZK76_ANETH|nr:MULTISPECIES: DUF6884 domain-containing protein [Aneurinibacillus]AMA72416.1 hypothetical protein ACH33_05840 [Aneurinibacillus sp. XH2]MED0679890.1 hypothetical protein [Aneurinibacillus thermoaerophilus]MED0735607.1 hypothetical protein [Aneurinibacillus thermoaerophilus]MED0758804.1 hypothetical protein [Aneurinibacillus thermoaerophilus]MED0759420.1 hypothetical protein [Aneurinibacillus thermoaerophilus]